MRWRSLSPVASDASTHYHWLFRAAGERQCVMCCSWLVSQPFAHLDTTPQLCMTECKTQEAWHNTMACVIAMARLGEHCGSW